jgi:hypothetical protein
MEAFITTRYCGLAIATVIPEIDKSSYPADSGQ